MDSRVLGAMAAGHGLVAAATWRDLGVRPDRIATLARAGELVSVRRGVYTTGELWDRWDVFHARPLARVRAAHLTLTVPHVFSHDSAALLLGIPLIRPQAAEVHVTRPVVRGSRTRYGVRHHGAPYVGAAVLDVDGLPTLDVARTVADLARTHGYRAGLVAADSAMRSGVERAVLCAAIESMPGWPGVTSARAAVEDADPGAESPGETLARELMVELGWAPVETQFPVLLRRGPVWCDLQFGCHVVEFDGRIKFRSVEQAGVATAGADDVWWDERRRQHEICAEGLGMSRLTWSDLFGPARGRAKERLQAEYAVTLARFGPALPARLEESADRFRGQRFRGAADRLPRG